MHWFTVVEYLLSLQKVVHHDTSPSWLSTVSLRPLNCIAMTVLGEDSKVVSHCLLHNFPFSSPSGLVVNKKLDPSLPAF